MAIKYPIVLNNGELEQLQAGDELPGGTLAISRINPYGGPIAICSVLSCNATHLAICERTDATEFTGLATETIAAGDPGDIQVSGIVEAGVAEWQNIITGGASLTPGAYYYADTWGKMSTLVPATVGDRIKLLGIALSTTEFLLTPEVSVEVVAGELSFRVLVSNSEVVSWVPGTIVRGTTGAGLRDNNSDAGEPIGLAIETIMNGSNGHVQTHGPLELTAFQWQAITKSGGSLVAGEAYYTWINGQLIAESDGDLPSIGGLYCKYIGKALSTTVLNINIQPTVYLQ
jgi:predicted RecA/RadA family phage recombinase